MGSVVRAKFRVVSHEIQMGDALDKKMGTVKLQPVVGGTPENDSFYRFTPAGEIVLSTVNNRVLDALEVGQDFYVDFTPATSG